MRRLIFVLIIAFAISMPAENIEEGFSMFYSRYDAPNEAEMIKSAERAMSILDENFNEIKTDDSLLFEYILAKDFYINTLKMEKTKKKKIYSKLLDVYLDVNKGRDNPYLNFSLAIIYGRYAEVCNIIDAVKANIPNKIKKYAERVIEQDSTLNEYGIYLMLGRLHAMTPKIIYITNWPSLEKSEMYLKKYIDKNPQTIIGKLYLAETYRMKKSDFKHDSLIEIIKKSLPEDNTFYEDKRIIDSLRAE